MSQLSQDEGDPIPEPCGFSFIKNPISEPEKMNHDAQLRISLPLPPS
jgi:hypothetical protein